MAATNKSIVTFLGCSKDPVEIAYSTLSIRESNQSPRMIWQEIQTGDISREAMWRLLARHGIALSQHIDNSVYFLFVIDDLSSAAMGSLNQSLAELGAFLIPNSVTKNLSEPTGMVTPPSIQKHPELMRRWNHISKELVEFYYQCEKEDVDDAERRLILPLGTSIREQYSLTFQSIQALLDIYMCEAMDWELKQMAWEIYDSMKIEFPSLSNRLGVRCWENRNLFCDKEYDVYQACYWKDQRPHQTDFQAIIGENRPLTKADC